MVSLSNKVDFASSSLTFADAFFIRGNFCSTERAFRVFFSFIAAATNSGQFLNSFVFTSESTEHFTQGYGPVPQRAVEIVRRSLQRLSPKAAAGDALLSRG